jgi:hypothetical protein
MMDKVPKKKTMSVDFSQTFPPLDFLTLEVGTNRLSQNICNELSLYAVQYLRRAEGSCDNLVMHALLDPKWSSSEQSSLAQSSSSLHT